MRKILKMYRYLDKSCRLAIASFISVILIVALYFGFLKPPKIEQSNSSSTPNTKLYRKYSHAAVVSNSAPCSTIAKNILQKGGKAVDAIISSLLCEGVTMPHTLGIGGGSFMTIYEKSWSDILMPTISLCENGITINKILGRMLVKYEDEIQSDPEFRTLRIIAEKGGDEFYKGTIAKNLVRDIQQAGGIVTEEDLEKYEARVENSFETKLFSNYTLHTAPPPSSGPILSFILKLVEGIVPAPNELLNTQRITEAMKHAYGARSRLGDPKFVDISKTMNLITSDIFIKNIREGISDTKTWDDPAHYGGDYIEPNNMGTANLAVLAENGDAVVATSTINMEFGSFVISKSTGILLNNQMDDFSSPSIVNNYGITPSKSNYIAPGKIPMSSTCPTIVLNESGDVRLLIGGGGGTKITSSVAITIIRNLLLKENIKESMNHALFHHQLMPMVWQYYPRMSPEIVEGMKKIGHKVKLMPHNSFVAITGVERRNGDVYPCSDFRRPGEVEGY